MLAQILRQLQQFAIEHDTTANVVYLNPRHFEALCSELPGLRSGEPGLPLGFHIRLQPSSSLPHPRVARLADRASAEPITPKPAPVRRNRHAA